MFPESSPQLDFSEETFQHFQGLLQERKNLDLYSYKDKCIQRRIAIRIRARECRNPEEYLKLLEEEEEELELLFNILTINVSQFFRNPETFTQIKKLVFPEIISRKETEGNRLLRILSLGCASGEEPYSLAIILLDSFSSRLKDFNVQIVGMDLDAKCLEQARKALYNPERLAEVEPRIKERYFLREGDKYRLVDKVKKMVSFKQGDIFRDRIANYLDLIVCRNVLIYFSRQEQDKVMVKCEKALKKGGILVLGKSEAILGKTPYTFKAINLRERIYQKSNN